ncbi:hypothetical protein EJB05_50088, partial [Eragrostis curvula]
MFSYFHAQFAALGHQLPPHPSFAPRPPISSPPMPGSTGSNVEAGVQDMDLSAARPLFPHDTIVAKTSFDRDSTDDASTQNIVMTMADLSFTDMTLYCASVWCLPLPHDAATAAAPRVRQTNRPPHSWRATASKMNYDAVASVGAPNLRQNHIWRMPHVTVVAVLNDGNVVAVKMFPEETDNFPMPIIDHVINLQHKNIVKVLGCCYEYKHQPYVVRLLKRNSPVILGRRMCAKWKLTGHH